MSSRIEAPSFTVQMKIEKDSDGSFLLTCPQIGCIFVQEESYEAVVNHGVEAVAAYLELSLEHGDPIPDCIVDSTNSNIEMSDKGASKVVPREDLELTKSFDCIEYATT